MSHFWYALKFDSQPLLSCALVCCLCIDFGLALFWMPGMELYTLALFVW